MPMRLLHPLTVQLHAGPRLQPEVLPGARQLVPAARCGASSQVASYADSSCTVADIVGRPSLPSTFAQAARHFCVRSLKRK